MLLSHWRVQWGIQSPWVQGALGERYWTYQFQRVMSLGKRCVYQALMWWTVCWSSRQSALGKILESSNVMASFSTHVRDFLFIALIVLHSLVGSDLWSSVSTNGLHVCLCCSFVVLVILSFICCRAIEVGSLDMRSSRALVFSNISAGTGSVLRQCQTEGIWCDAAFRMMVCKIFSFFGSWLEATFCSACPLISLRYRSQLAFLKLELIRWGIRLIVRSIRKLMRIGRWSESMFVLVCQLVEVIREADANETSGEDGLALLSSLVAGSQLRIPTYEPDIMFSYLLSLSTTPSGVHWSLQVLGYLCHHQMVQGRKVTSCARACWGVCRCW